MKIIKYFFEFIIISFLFLVYKILGLKASSFISGKLFEFFGPLFRSKQIIKLNIKRAIPQINLQEMNNIKKNMWNNYGRTLSEYMFLKNFRNTKLESIIHLEGEEILEQIKNEKTPVIFVSGHFSNFELMAMQIEKSGIDLASIYRPLNNIFLNPVMEKIRKKYICKYQIKKGISGTKELLKYFKKNFSIALMIDQRVSEGIECDFFNKKALTTTIPAQFIKKFNVEVVPVYIERSNENDFNVEFFKPLKFNKNENIATITLELNKILEKMIQKNPDQWIWTHNRWK